MYRLLLVHALTFDMRCWSLLRNRSFDGIECGSGCEASHPTSYSSVGSVVTGALRWPQHHRRQSLVTACVVEVQRDTVSELESAAVCSKGPGESSTGIVFPPYA